MMSARFFMGARRHHAVLPVMGQNHKDPFLNGEPGLEAVAAPAVAVVVMAFGDLEPPSFVKSCCHALFGMLLVYR